MSDIPEDINMMILPEAFEQKMKGLLGQEWNVFLNSYRNQRYQALRFNCLKKDLNKECYGQVLGKLNIHEQIPVPWAEHAFYFTEQRAVDPVADSNPACQPGKHPYHEMGLYYIQEPSAMSAAALLEPQPGECILDLCAAPGGKSTQIACAMRQEGLLVVNEIHPARAKILSQNMERMGVANAIVCNEDSEGLAEHFVGYFDRILVDAPCSGEGMFRKNPLAAQEWSPQNVMICRERQAQILDQAAVMLAEGGRLVYSTCTFSPEENEQTIGAFLERHPQFGVVSVDAPYFSRGIPSWGDGRQELARTFRLWPHRLHGEGHYVAVLCKGTPEKRSELVPRKMKKKSILSKEQQSTLDEFLKQAVCEDIAAWIVNGRLELFGDQLYRLPDSAPSIAGLHVLRAGLHIGTYKKNRLEPSHALALFLGKEQAKQTVCLDTGRDADIISAYYRGETITAAWKKGWSLVCIDGYSAGWGKAAGGVLKNHYPKGLRR